MDTLLVFSGSNLSILWVSLVTEDSLTGKRIFVQAQGGVKKVNICWRVTGESRTLTFLLNQEVYDVFGQEGPVEDVWNKFTN